VVDSVVPPSFARSRRLDARLYLISHRFRENPLEPRVMGASNSSSANRRRANEQSSAQGRDPALADLRAHAASASTAGTTTTTRNANRASNANASTTSTQQVKKMRESRRVVT